MLIITKASKRWIVITWEGGYDCHKNSPLWNKSALTINDKVFGEINFINISFSLSRAIVTFRIRCVLFPAIFCLEWIFYDIISYLCSFYSLDSIFIIIQLCSFFNNCVNLPLNFAILCEAFNVILIIRVYGLFYDILQTTIHFHDIYCRWTLIGADSIFLNIFKRWWGLIRSTSFSRVMLRNHEIFALVHTWTSTLRCSVRLLLIFPYFFLRFIQRAISATPNNSLLSLRCIFLISYFLSFLFQITCRRLILQSIILLLSIDLVKWMLSLICSFSLRIGIIFSLQRAGGHIIISLD